jgi:aminopeptidase N
VQSKTIFGGMENAGAIFYFEKSVTGHGGIDDLLAHEIAHQWFGDMVTETNFKHVWLSEGFATYLTDLYVESKNGTDSLHRRLANERNTVIDFMARTTAPVIDTASDYFKLLSPNSYQKGGWVLHMLRMMVGDAVFKNIIREQYKKFAGSNASTEDFIATAQRVSHKNLQLFFKQWLYQPGIPVVGIAWEYRSRSKKLIVSIEQQQPGLFTFPIELQLTVGNKKMLKTVQVQNRKTLVAFSVNEKVTELIADPNFKLLWQQVSAKE